MKKKLTTSVNREWVLSQEAFDTFLAWLDADRDRAGEKYEEIRCELIKDFVHRESLDPEGLADEVLNRVIRELPEIIGTYAGDPALYVYSVAQRLPLRFWRKAPANSILPVIDPDRIRGVTSASRVGWHPWLIKDRELSLNHHQQERLH